MMRPCSPCVQEGAAPVGMREPGGCMQAARDAGTARRQCSGARAARALTQAAWRAQMR